MKIAEESFGLHNAEITSLHSSLLKKTLRKKRTEAFLSLGTQLLTKQKRNGVPFFLPFQNSRSPPLITVPLPFYFFSADPYPQFFCQILRCKVDGTRLKKGGVWRCFFFLFTCIGNWGETRPSWGGFANELAVAVVEVRGVINLLRGVTRSKQMVSENCMNEPIFLLLSSVSCLLPFHHLIDH